MLQQRRVEVAAAVFVADGVDGGWGLGAGGWGADSVHDFAEQADGDVREGGAFVAVVGDQVVELCGENESRANEERSDAGGIAGAAKRAAKRVSSSAAASIGSGQSKSSGQQAVL